MRPPAEQAGEPVRGDQTGSSGRRLRLPLATAVGTAGLALARAIARGSHRSGATDEEVNASLPGDGLVAGPMWQSTRCITIHASPGAIWPWLVQMGFPTYRAGWYTPFWLDRLMWHIRARSADRVIPELQQLAVGDRVPDSPDLSAFFTVANIEPERALVLHSTTHVLHPYKDLNFTWAFVLADDGDATRLIVRSRVRYEPVWPAAATRLFVRLVIGLGDLLNASVMLHGIKRRVEREARSP